MGNQKQKWTAEEEDALLAGVAKHGPGKWKNILKDPDFAPSLTNRSNIDLKDKWRNLSVSTGGSCSKDKAKTPKIKAVVAAAAAAAATPNAPNSAPSASVTHNASSDTAMDDPSNSIDGNNVYHSISISMYNAMIFEALSTSKDKNGADISAIVNYIEQRQEVPQNFRRSLSSRLRRLVSQGKLEKVENCYKIRNDTSLVTKTPTPKQKDVRPQRPQSLGSMASSETVEEAAMTAAYKVAEAENKSFLAAEAVKEAERVSKMAEDADSMLQIVKEIYEQCSQGETVILA